MHASYLVCIPCTCIPYGDVPKDRFRVEVTIYIDDSWNIESCQCGCLQLLAVGINDVVYFLFNWLVHD